MVLLLLQKNRMKLLGILLIVAGLSALVFRTVIEKNVDGLKTNTQWYVYVGGLATAAGVYLLLGKPKPKL